MSRVRRSRRAALLGLLGLSCLLVAGCGIPTTGVVQAGEPGIGIQRSVELYFVSQRDGSLVLLTRRFGTPAQADSSVRLLFHGLAPEEQKVLGLTTQVPAAPVTIHYQGHTMAVDVAAERLDPVAVDQITCTALAALAADSPKVRTDRSTTVTVTASGLPQLGSPDPPAHCAAAHRPTPVAKTVETFPSGTASEG